MAADHVLRTVFALKEIRRAVRVNGAETVFAEKSRIEKEADQAEIKMAKARIQEEAERSIDSFFQNLGMKSPEAQYYALNLS